MRALAVIALVALVALVACGSTADPPPPAKAAPASPPPLTLLDEAARLAKSPDDRIALARAYATRGDTAQAHEALRRADSGLSGTAPLIVALDAHVALGDDRAARLERAALDLENMEVGREAFLDTLAAAETKPVIARVGLALARVPLEGDFKRFADIVDEVAGAGELAPNTPLWQAVVDGAAGDPERLRVLAATARRLGAHDVAATLVHAAAAKGASFALAEELALQHEPALARAIAKRSVFPLRDRERAGVLEAAFHAQLEAVLGDAAASQAWEAKLLELAGSLQGFEDVADGHQVELLEAALGIALAARGASTEAIPHFRTISDRAGDTAAFLVEAGHRDVAIQAAAAMPAAKRDLAIAAILRIDVMAGERARARDLALATGSGLEQVLLADARAGDVDAVTRLLREDRSVNAGVTRLVVRMQLAWTLARTGKCDLARPLARELGNATTYAIVARHCPP